MGQLKIINNMDLHLDGKRALVTGGSRGIGKSIVDILKSEGVITESVSRTNGYNLMLDGIDKIKESYKFKGTDILINNVGGGGRWGDNPLKFDEWKEVYQKNAGVMTELTNHFLPYMIQNQWGRVITIASIYGKEAGGKPWFTMAKASQIAYMKEMSRQGYRGVTFNCVSPGYIDTNELNRQRKDIPVGCPEDISTLVAFLCSNNARFINGANISVDGGLSYSW